jgi:hypothetical protein
MQIEEMAQAYTEALDNSPNGWGQHCHPVTGQRSDYIMRDMWQRFGKDASNIAILRTLKEKTV